MLFWREGGISVERYTNPDCKPEMEELMKDCPRSRSGAECWLRLCDIEDILGDEYDLERLRELAQVDSLIGKTVYEPNKRGFISTYEVISTHISKCSILIGWNLLDGVYSNLNGFEISALGKTVFLTREEAEAAISERG